MFELLLLALGNAIVGYYKPALRPNLASLVHACIMSYASVYEPSLFRLVSLTAGCFLIDTVASLMERRYDMIVHHVYVIVGTGILMVLLYGDIFSRYPDDIATFTRILCGFEWSTIPWSLYNGYRQYYHQPSKALMIVFACVFVRVRLWNLPALVQILIRCYEPSLPIYYACVLWCIGFIGMHLYWPFAMWKKCRRLSKDK